MALKTPDHRLCQADFEHQVLYGKVLVLHDVNMGGCSLTNEMAAALQEVARMEKIRLAGFAVIYKDSAGEYARVLLDEAGGFAGFAGLGRAVFHQDEAEELLRIQLADDGRGR